MKIDPALELMKSGAVVSPESSKISFEFFRDSIWATLNERTVPVSESFVRAEYSGQNWTAV